LRFRIASYITMCCKTSRLPLLWKVMIDLPLRGNCETYTAAVDTIASWRERLH